MSIQITSSYRIGTYGEIEEFSQQVILKIDGVPRFADLQLQIEIVKEKLGIFTIAVAEATDGGKLLTQAKIIAKKELIRELNSLKDLVKVFAKGEVKDMPKGAVELAIKYSYDGWVTEHNGTYSSGKKFVLEGLEVKREVEVKVAFHGTFQRQSNYSDAMRIFVL